MINWLFKRENSFIDCSFYIAGALLVLGHQYLYWFIYVIIASLIQASIKVFYR